MKLKLFIILLFGVLGAASAQQTVSLEDVVAVAVESNYDVRVARQVSEAASTDKQYVAGAFLPRINAVGTTLWNKNDQVIRFESNPDREGDVASNNLTGSVQLAWTLFDGSRMFATRARIGELEQQAQLQLKDQINNSIANIILNYYDVVRQKQQLNAIREQMLVNEERVKLAEKKLQVGTGTKPELLQAQVDLNAQRAQVIQQQAVISQLKQQLNVLAGGKLPDQFEVADTILIDLNLNESVVEQVESNNLTLQATKQGLSASNLVIRERRAEYLPFLDFNASYNYNRTDFTKILNPFSPVFTQNEGLNYGFTLNIPILNGFNTRRLVQQSKIEFSRQSLLYEQQKLTLNATLRNALINYDNARQILAIEEETIGAARENVAIALETFRRGVTTFIELRTAQQSLSDAYNRLIAARYNAKVAETELLRLNGSFLR